jgi:indole-3-glycerol phosphate synthase
MMNILKEILENKRLEVGTAKKTIPLQRLHDMSGYSRKCLSLKNSLNTKDVAVIAEIKKASPSKGIICTDFDPLKIAREYVAGGAAAVSVLTDRKYFQGHIHFMSDIRASVPVPLLRKDFIIDSYQLTEAKAFGADAVLLIAAAMDPEKLKDLHSEAAELGLECLVEVHSESELHSLDFSRVRTVGINNRNLADFKIDISTASRLAVHIPKNVTIVSESGIRTRTDIEKLAGSGIHAVLVGESLMRSSDPKEALAELLTPLRGKR